MIDKKYLLNTEQMANFVADGYLRFDELIPRELNEAAHAEMEEGIIVRGRGGTVLDEVWDDDSAVGKVFRLPEVQGIIHSLVGKDPLYDHHAVHIVRPQNQIGQIWHADAIIDLRMHFDIQFFYFSHDTPREMGGTMILPGATTAACVRRTSRVIKTSSDSYPSPVMPARFLSCITGCGTAHNRISQIRRATCLNSASTQRYANVNSGTQTI